MKKTVFSTIVFLFLGSILFSCKGDGPEPIQQLETKVIDCSTNVESGQTLILENRNDGVDYIINCVYYVDGDLTIKPGVTIQFGTDSGIAVGESGSLQVLGLSTEQVVFTGEDKTAGAWKGIFIDSDDNKNRIEYAKIEYAGGGAFNSNGDKGSVVVYAGAKLNLNNTSLISSETYGINADYNGADLVLDNNTITSCNMPMRIKPQYAGKINGGVFTGNTTDVIEIYSYTTGLSIQATWTNLGVPYRIIDFLTISPGGELTIDPGVIMEFGLDAGIYVDEGANGPKPSLIAVGTVDEPIIFTGVNKVLGAWRGIYFDSPSALNIIENVTIEYASNPNQKGAIDTWYGTVLNVHDVNFKHIQRCSLHIYHNGSHAITYSNLFHDDVANTICEN